jgi:hypothetical protein
MAALVDRAGRDILRRQIEEAARWVRDGAVVRDLPCAVGRESEWARLVVRRDRQAGGRSDPDGPPRVEVRLETRRLGRVEVQARWSRPVLDARISVERPATRDLFETRRHELVARLGEAGFTQTTGEGLCDPARLAQPASLPGEHPPPGGSLVDVRA